MADMKELSALGIFYRTDEAKKEAYNQYRKEKKGGNYVSRDFQRGN